MGEPQVDVEVLQVGADAAEVAQQALELRRDVSRCLGLDGLHNNLSAGSIVGAAASGLGRSGLDQMPTNRSPSHDDGNTLSHGAATENAA
jgi:hypothetical protein